jgi:deoxyhypusine synthase
MNNFLDVKIKPYKIKKGSSVNAMVDMMKNSAFQGRNIAVARDIWVKMLGGNTTIFLGLAGAMVPAGMRGVIAYLIKNRFIDCLVSTGANLFHDCHETLGRFHFQGSHEVDDIKLFKKGIDRIYDVFASEKEFRKADNFVKTWASTLNIKRGVTTREFLYLLGEKLSKISNIEGILTSAYKAKVPIYCPAVGDSSIGIALAAGRAEGSNKIQFDVIKDVLETAEIVSKSKTTGVIYIGGGTPKNFIQQTEVTASIISNSASIGHKYAIQVTADSPHWGGLSGCTFKEAQSWGKIARDASSVSLHSDATIAMPIIATAVASSFNIRRRKKPKFILKEDLKMIL